MANIITPILKPFANGRLTSSYPNVLPSVSANNPDMVANQETGFPIPQLLPLSTTGSTPVKEEEMNGVLYFYTNLLYQAGLGYQYTFDANLSAAVGGYSLGAVLYCSSNGSFQKSLKANNTANFVTNTNYINDGTNWKQITYNVYDVFPDIMNTYSDGSVFIGFGRVNNSTVQIGAYSISGARSFITLTTVDTLPQLTLNILDTTQSLNNGIFLTLNQRPQLNMPTPVTSASILALPFNNQSFLVAQDILQVNVNNVGTIQLNACFIRRADVTNYNIIVMGKVNVVTVSPSNTFKFPLSLWHSGTAILEGFGTSNCAFVNTPTEAYVLATDLNNLTIIVNGNVGNVTVYFSIFYAGPFVP
jgi:hypothetical protein